MARLERIDLAEGGAPTETQDGYEVVRVAWVAELTGRAEERLYNAVRAAGVPRFGEPHPSIPHLRVVQRSAAFEGGNDRAVVTLTYRVPQANEAPPSDPGGGSTSAGVVRVGSTVQGGTTQKDAFGNPITVIYGTDPDTIQGADVELSIPQLVLSETRKETRTPADKARAFVGKVNQFACFGGAARTYLCTGIQGVTNDGGSTYEVKGDYLVCHALILSAIGETLEGTQDINVAKPYLLRTSITERVTSDGVVTYAYASDTERTATLDATSETQKITPDYAVGDVILAVRGIVGGTLAKVDGVPLQWMDITPRAWAKSS